MPSKCEKSAALFFNEDQNYFQIRVKRHTTLYFHEDQNFQLLSRAISANKIRKLLGLGHTDSDSEEFIWKEPNLNLRESLKVN